MSTPGATPQGDITAIGGLIEVPIEELKLGMYVAALDRPWLESPFKVQGFYVRNYDDLTTLRRLCRHVFVDPRVVERLPHERPIPVERPRAASIRVTAAAAARTGADTRNDAIPGRHAYQDSVGMREEFHVATRELQSVTTMIARVFERLREGKGLDVEAVSQAVQPIIGSVLRNKDAMAALVRIKRKDEYTYGHSISTAIWATVFGRHLGFDRQDLQVLALSCALLDVGKAALPRPLLVKPDKLSTAEMQLMRGHVEESVRLLEHSGSVDPRVMQIVAAHHERHDGSGYPRGLIGLDIPLGARIAGLVDSYDAMTTTRPYAKARSSFEAMQELARAKDTLFQAELVEQLMQAIGLFPTGSLVELDSGAVAIVVGQNPSRRLKPKVVIVLDADKRRCADFPLIDLLAAELAAGGAPAPRIARELPPGAYGIDAQEYYL
jgi:HD-GYP domain-containing protein (c-di-GMP phosphodiesterase class II)